MGLKFTILGCGSSGGVPHIGPHWGDCDPKNPKNARRRCSLLVERQASTGKTVLLIDSSPDMRIQLLEAQIAWLDGVLFTHSHADHTHGIDDLRMVSFNGHRRIKTYYDRACGELLKKSFRYCFETLPGSSYQPILEGYEISHFESFDIDGPGGVIRACPFEQIHGNIHSLGFRFGGLAYSTDVSDLSEQSAAFLKGLDIWIIDALRYRPHPNHFSVEEALSWIDRLKPKRAILTHLHIDLDYQTLAENLPEGVEPAYDGMVLEIDG